MSKIKIALAEYDVDDISSHSLIKNGHVIAFILAEDRKSDRVAAAANFFQKNFNIRPCKTTIRDLFDLYLKMSKNSGKPSGMPRIIKFFSTTFPPELPSLPQEASTSATVRPILTVSPESHALYRTKIVDLESKLNTSLEKNRLLKNKASAYHRRYKRLLLTHTAVMQEKIAFKRTICRLRKQLTWQTKRRESSKKSSNVNKEASETKLKLQQAIAKQQIDELKTKLSSYEDEIFQLEEKLKDIGKTTISTKKCGQYTDEIRRTTFC